MGNQGFQGEARAPGSVAHRARKGIIYYLQLRATKQTSNNENVPVGKPTEGYRYHNQRNLTPSNINRV